MPGFDGSGPMGMGPMTGGGRGFCTAPGGYIGPGAGIGLGRGGFPRGGGRGMGFGRGRGPGRGMGRGFGWRQGAWPGPAYNPYYDPGYDPAYESVDASALQNQVNALLKENESLKKRLEELEKGA